MKQSINEYQFRDAFQAIRPENFTYKGLTALYEYLTELEENTGEEAELDVIGLCCDFTEYKNLEEIQENYSGIGSMDDLYDRTQVIEFEGGIIIQDF